MPRFRRGAPTTHLRMQCALHRVRCPERARVIIKPWKPFSRPFFFCEVPREGFDYLRCCGGVRTFTPNVDAQGGLEALFFIQPIGELLEDFPSLVYSEADREYAIPRRLEELPHDNARIPCSFRRVAASHRVNQLLQRLLDARLRLLDARSSGARTANSTALSAARFQLPVPLVNRRARQSRRVRNQSIASVSDGTRFRGRPDTTPALIEIRLDHRRTSQRLSLRVQHCVSSAE